MLRFSSCYSVFAIRSNSIQFTIFYHNREFLFTIQITIVNQSLPSPVMRGVANITLNDMT